MGDQKKKAFQEVPRGLQFYSNILVGLLEEF